MTKLRVAVVGAGHLGRIHARLLAARNDVALVAVVDPVPEARARVAADLGLPTLPDHRLLAGQIDAAVVAAPTRLHREVTLDLVGQNVHCLVEKPLAMNVSEADELVAAAERSGVVLTVGHVEQFNPAFVAARPSLRGARYIDAARHSGFTFRSTDVGVVLDLMIHDLDLVLSLAGSELVSVEALGLALLGRNEDVAQARLTFAGGLVANLSASRVSTKPCRQMQVWADEAMASIDLAERSASLVRPGPEVLRREVDVERLSPDDVARVKDRFLQDHLPAERLTVEDRNAIGDELEDFVAAIQTGGAPRVDGRQGRAALAAAERVLESIAHHCWEGRADGPIGPLARPRPTILRGPHWRRDAQATPPLRREAG